MFHAESNPERRDRGEYATVESLRHRAAEARRQALDEAPFRLADCQLGDIVRTITADARHDEEWTLEVVDHLVDEVAVRRVKPCTMRAYGEPFSLSGARGCLLLARKR